MDKANEYIVLVITLGLLPSVLVSDKQSFLPSLVRTKSTFNHAITHAVLESPRSFWELEQSSFPEGDLRQCRVRHALNPLCSLPYCYHDRSRFDNNYSVKEKRRRRDAWRRFSGSSPLFPNWNANLSRMKKKKKCVFTSSRRSTYNV